MHTLRAAAPPAGETPIGMLLTALGRASLREISEALKPTGLKPRHLAVLTELRERPRRQGELGEATGTDPTKLVGLLNDLEERGLVERRRDPADRRRHIVEISAAGRARLDDVDALVAITDDRLTAGLDPERRRMLGELLAQVAERGGISATCNAVADIADEPAEAG